MVIGMKKVIARKKAEGDLDAALEVRHDLILYMMRKSLPFVISQKPPELLTKKYIK